MEKMKIDGILGRDLPDRWSNWFVAENEPGERWATVKNPDYDICTSFGGSLNYFMEYATLIAIAPAMYKMLQQIGLQYYAAGSTEEAGEIADLLSQVKFASEAPKNAAYTKTLEALREAHSLKLRLEWLLIQHDSPELRCDVENANAMVKILDQKVKEMEAGE